MRKKEIYVYVRSTLINKIENNHEKHYISNLHLQARRRCKTYTTSRTNHSRLSSFSFMYDVHKALLLINNKVCVCGLDVIELYESRTRVAIKSINNKKTYKNITFSIFIFTILFLF